MIPGIPTRLLPPTHCPSCTTQLVLRDHNPFCPNFNCPYRTYGRLQKFVDTLNLKGLGEETLRSIVKAQLANSPADLFDITREQFTKLERLGDAHYNKFRQGLETAKLLTPAQVMSAHDIAGPGTWDHITKVPGLSTLQDILAAIDRQDIQLFDQATNVSETTAKEIFQATSATRASLERFIALIQVKTLGTTLAGKTFCITGSLSKPRPEIEAWIKENGGAVSSDVSSKTTHLVTNQPDPTSSKAKKAAAKGIPTITEAALRALAPN